jgi:signal transduction histidine kinase
MDATLTSGWLFAAVPAAVIVHDRMVERRRRRQLNRSLHELRRPLQAMALGGVNRNVDSGGGFLDLAMSALTDLDHLVNGAAACPPGARHELLSCRELVVAAVGRWRAGDSEVNLELFWDAGEAIVSADAEQIARALDNMIANAIEHGGPRLALTASVVSGKVRLTLSDWSRSPYWGARRQAASSNGAAPPQARDPRRGHGLEIVTEIAAAHGGRFALSRSVQGTVAALELPLARTSRAIA